MKKNLYENQYASFWIQDDWLLCIQYKKDLEITLDVAIDCTKIRMEVSENTLMPMFTDGRNIKSIQKEAREFLSKQGTKLVKAGAFLIQSPFERMIGNVFVKINRPQVPTEFFTNENEALKWLEKYK